VADRSIFGDREAEFLKELIRQKVEFMVVGLSAAALQGAPVVTQDIDLWFRDVTDPGVASALEKVHGVYVPPTAEHPPMFAGKAVQLFDIVVHMHGLGEFEEEIENALKVRLGRFKVPVLKLERIIESKKATGREKDKLAVKVLSDALLAIREREKQ
jgi:hypothetical protein